MPVRVKNAGKEVDDWAERTGNRPTRWDLCTSCAHLASRNKLRPGQSSLFPENSDREPDEEEPVGQTLEVAISEEPTASRCDCCGSPYM